MIRLFAAVAIPDQIAAGLAPRLKGILGARWRPADSLHITLRFFGAVAEDAADDLDSELAAICGAAAVSAPQPQRALGTVRVGGDGFL